MWRTELDIRIPDQPDYVERALSQIDGQRKVERDIYAPGV